MNDIVELIIFSAVMSPIIILLFALLKRISPREVAKRREEKEKREEDRRQLSINLGRIKLFVGFQYEPEFKEYASLPNLEVRGAYLAERFPDLISVDESVNCAYTVDGWGVEKILGEHLSDVSLLRRHNADRVRNIAIAPYNQKVSKENQVKKLEAKKVWESLTTEDKASFRKQQGDDSRKAALHQLGESRGIDLLAYYPILMAVYFSSVSPTSSSSINYDSSSSSSSSSLSSYDGGLFGGGGASGSW